MKTFSNFLFFCLITAFTAQAQKSYTIDYSKDSLLNPDCIFNSGPRQIQNFLHAPSIGKVLYSTSEKSLLLGSV